MGQRLTITYEDYEKNNCDIQYYGTKLFGYVKDMKELKSFWFLVNNNKFSDNFMGEEDINEIEESLEWAINYYVKNPLSPMEFQKFITLYNDDRHKQYGDEYDMLKDKDIIRLLSDDRDKYISFT